MARKKRVKPDRSQEKQAPESKQEQVEGKGNSKFTNSFNDVSWYTHYPELTASVARIPFPYRAGMQFTAEKSNVTQPDGSTNIKYRVPGVCQLQFDWTIGISADTRSPASLAAFQMYKRIRRAYSGALNVDAADLMLYALGLDQIYAYIAYLKRAYRTVSAYSAMNRYLPEVILHTELADIGDTDARDLTINKDKMWNYINTLVRRISTFQVPADLDIFKRHSFMCEHVFADSNELDSQNYVFTPIGWYELQEDAETGTKLKHWTILELRDEYYGHISPPRVAPTYGWLTLDFLMWVGDKLSRSFLNWDDTHMINGYIMRAFEGSEFFSPALLFQDEAIEIQYVPEVLMQIHNATLNSEYRSGDITQDPVTGAILHAPESIGHPIFTGSSMLDMPTSNPSEPEIVLATRLTAMVSEDYQQLASGTEIVVGITFSSPDPALSDDQGIVDGWNWYVSNGLFLQDDPDQLVYAAKKIRFMAASTAWSMAPRIPVQITMEFHEHPVPEGQFSFYVSDITHPSVIGWEQLKEVHDVCLYSEFDSFT